MLIISLTSHKQIFKSLLGVVTPTFFFVFIVLGAASGLLVGHYLHVCVCYLTSERELWVSPKTGESTGHFKL